MSFSEITGLLVLSKEWGNDPVTNNNHPIPPFPSIPYVKRTSKQAVSRSSPVSRSLFVFRCEFPWPQDGLTIENPEGFSSEYLLKASKLMIDLDMQKLITSWGKTLEVEKAVYGGLWVANGKRGFPETQMLHV